MACCLSDGQSGQIVTAESHDRQFLHDLSVVDVTRNSGHAALCVEDQNREDVSEGFCMNWPHRHVNALRLLSLESALMCLVASCAEVPNYYWVKYGGTQEQIIKDNTFCADMTAEKPSAYARGSAFYYAPLDQPAYQECMRSLGYQKVTNIAEAEFKRESSIEAPRPLAHLNATRELCQRVIGAAGDIESCIRYMNMDVRGLFTTAQSGNHDSPESSDFTASQQEDACLRRDPKDISGFTMVVTRKC